MTAGLPTADLQVLAGTTRLSYVVSASSDRHLVDGSPNPRVSLLPLHPPHLGVTIALVDVVDQPLLLLELPAIPDTKSTWMCIRCWSTDKNRKRFVVRAHPRSTSLTLRTHRPRLSDPRTSRDRPL